MTPGRVRAGTVYEQTGWLPSSTTERMAVSALTAPCLLGIAGQLDPFAADLQYELALDGPSRTTVRNVADLAASGPLGALAGLAAARVRPPVQRNVGQLRAIVAGRPIDGSGGHAARVGGLADS